MNAAITLLLVTLSAPLAVADDDTPVLRLGGEEFTRETFEDWLFDRYSAEALREFTTMQSVERAARDAGITVSEADVDARLEEERQTKIERFFDGDPAAYDADLVRLGYSPDSWRRFRAQHLRHELLMERLVLADRVVTEEQIEKRYDVIYGQDHERTELELLFFGHRTGQEPGSRTPREDLIEVSRARAEPIVERFAAGAPFDELRPLSDEILNEFVVDGRIERYRRNLLGPQLDRAIMLLDRPGETTELVTLFDGHVVARLVRRETVTLDDVRAELEAELLAAPPTSSEIMDLQNEALERYGAESLLR